VAALVVKTLLSITPALAHTYASCNSNSRTAEGGGSLFTCFEVLGFDVMFDQHLKPWLIEVNHSPSFACDSPLDEEIKEGLIAETLALVNVQGADRRKYKQRSASAAKARLYGGGGGGGGGGVGAADGGGGGSSLGGGLMTMRGSVLGGGHAGCALPGGGGYGVAASRALLEAAQRKAAAAAADPAVAAAAALARQRKVERRVRHQEGGKFSLIYPPPDLEPPPPGGDNAAAHAALADLHPPVVVADLSYLLEASQQLFDGGAATAGLARLRQVRTGWCFLRLQLMTTRD
jgi:hypothetical protein